MSSQIEILVSRSFDLVRRCSITNDDDDDDDGDDDDGDDDDGDDDDDSFVEVIEEDTCPAD